jgi:RNA polymerase sigma-70 factor (ECF subfamily)
MSAAYPLDPSTPPQLPPDREVVGRIRAGDDAAYGALYLAYHDVLWRFAYGYVRSAAVAEELVQEVFLAVWRGRADWVVTGSLRAWLYAAVRNQALKHLRHERIVARVAERHASALLGAADADVAVPAMASAPPDAHALVEAHDLEAAVERATATLPDRRRAVLTLRWRHELTPQEIAVVLGTTPDVVRVLLSRARRELATLLGTARA